MKTFYYRVFDYLYNKRLELFQSFFYELYKSFEGKQEEFVKTWFENYTVKKLLKHFPSEDVLTYYPGFALEKRNVIKSYIGTYWNFCKRPSLYPAKIRDSINFFSLEELSEEQLKRVYRAMVKAYHPDKHPDKENAHKKMLVINYHYQVLLSYLSEVRLCLKE